MKICSPSKQTPNEKELAFASLNIKGSLTLEASLLLVIITVSLMSLFTLFDVMLVQYKLQQALYDVTRNISTYAYIGEIIPNLWNSSDEKDGDDKDNSKSSIIAVLSEAAKGAIKNGINTGAVSVLVREKLKEDEVIGRRVKDGSQGFNFSYTFLSVDSEYLDVRVTYQIKLIGLPSFINKLQFMQRCRRRMYVGKEPKINASTEDGEASQQQDVVYKTKYGEVIHIYKDCSYLARDIKTVSVAAVQNTLRYENRIYRPCEYCVGNIANVHVYVTKEGTKYHNRRNCQTLLRYIEQYKKSSMESYPVCSLCKKRQANEQKELELKGAGT